MTSLLTDNESLRSLRSIKKLASPAGSETKRVCLSDPFPFIGFGGLLAKDRAFRICALTSTVSHAKGREIGSHMRITMFVVLRRFLLVLLLGAHVPAFAQDAGDAATEGEESTTVDGNSTNGLSMGVAATEIQIGQTYVADVHGDWEVRCVKTEGGKDPCQLYQLLQDGQGNSVAEINLFNLPDEGPAVAGATVITPLETLLTEPLRLVIDGGQARLYPYRFCTRVGCFARLGFTAEEIEAFKKGVSGTVSIVAAAAPDQMVDLNMSLIGFTAGWANVVERNAAVE